MQTIFVVESCWNFEQRHEHAQDVLCTLGFHSVPVSTRGSNTSDVKEVHEKGVEDQHGADSLGTTADGL